MSHTLGQKSQHLITFCNCGIIGGNGGNGGIGEWWWSFRGFDPLLLGNTWLSEMNLSIKQQKFSSFVASQTAIQALIGQLFSGQYLRILLSCQFFLAQNFSRLSGACEQYGGTYREACKRIEMARQPCDSTKLSMSSQRPPGAAIKSGYISSSSATQTH